MWSTGGDKTPNRGDSTPSRNWGDRTPNRGDSTPSRNWGDRTPNRGDSTPNRGDGTPSHEWPSNNPTTPSVPEYSNSWGSSSNDNWGNSAPSNLMTPNYQTYSPYGQMTPAEVRIFYSFLSFAWNELTKNHFSTTQLPPRDIWITLTHSNHQIIITEVSTVPLSSRFLPFSFFLFFHLAVTPQAYPQTPATPMTIPQTPGIIDSYSGYDNHYDDNCSLFFYFHQNTFSNFLQSQLVWQQKLK